MQWIKPSQITYRINAFIYPSIMIYINEYDKELRAILNIVQKALQAAVLS